MEQNKEFKKVSWLNLLSLFLMFSGLVMGTCYFLLPVSRPFSNWCVLVFALGFMVNSIATKKWLSVLESFPFVLFAFLLSIGISEAKPVSPGLFRAILIALFVSSFLIAMELIVKIISKVFRNKRF